MVCIASVFLFAASGYALVLQSRNVSEILPDLNDIDSDTKHVTAQVQRIGGVQPGGPDYYDMLIQDLESAQNNAAYPQSRPYTEAQATAICNYANRTLTPDTQALANMFVAKKDKIISEGLQDSALSDLKQLQRNTSSLLDTFVAMSPGRKQSTCSTASAVISKAYASAIAAISGK